jgi:hypothetical protein
MPSHLTPHRPALLIRDSPGNGARRHPARLQHKHGTISQKRRRHTSRFSGARRGRDDDRPMGRQRRANRWQVPIDGQLKEWTHAKMIQ